MKEVSRQRQQTGWHAAAMIQARGIAGQWPWARKKLVCADELREQWQGEAESQGEGALTGR